MWQRRSDGNGSELHIHFSAAGFWRCDCQWSIDANITDAAIPPNPFDPADPSATFLYRLVDRTVPDIVQAFPPRGLTLRELAHVDVLFNKAVVGVDASDLLVNGQAATNVVGFGSGPYRFTFAAPANGPVTVAWAQNHGIQDTNEDPNGFIGTSWNYTVNSAQTAPRVRINEIVAANENGLRDQFGAAEDWIELYNDESVPVNLEGWSLTDDVTKPDQWVFPAVTIGAKGVLGCVCFGTGCANARSAAVAYEFQDESDGRIFGTVQPGRAATGGEPFSSELSRATE